MGVQWEITFVVRSVKKGWAFLCIILSQVETLMVDFLNAVYFRRSLTCTVGLTNDLIDGGQLRAKPCLRKAKPNHVSLGWPPSIKSLVNPTVHVIPRLK